jgi:hypothetical protein
MDTDRKALMDWIEAEKPAFVAFLRDFIRAKSPNPPGDTREAAVSKGSSRKAVLLTASLHRNR